GEDGGDRGAADEAALAVPLGRDVLDRGDRRPARHAPAALRVGRAGRPAPPARPVRAPDAPVSRRLDRALFSNLTGQRLATASGCKTLMAYPTSSRSPCQPGVDVRAS